MLYEGADWIGVIATNHPGLVLHNKASVNPNKELFEPYIKYSVPIKEYIYDDSIDAYRIRHTKKDFWTLRWPTQQDYERRDTEKFIIATKSDKTQYGNVISDYVLEAIINTGMKDTDTRISRKWRNTKDFFDYVKTN